MGQVQGETVQVQSLNESLESSLGKRNKWKNYAELTSKFLKVCWGLIFVAIVKPLSEPANIFLYFRETITREQQHVIAQYFMKEKCGEWDNTHHKVKNELLYHLILWSFGSYGLVLGGKYKTRNILFGCWPGQLRCLEKELLTFPQYLNNNSLI